MQTLPPEVLGEVPGPRSRELATRLARVESRNVTCLAPVPPIFWERASGANVWDVDGNRYVDLTAAFGVAAVGHGHPEIVSAVLHQAGALLHGMGDVHPTRVKVEVLEMLAARFPGDTTTDGARAVLGSSGSDAVEIALKTALLSTGQSGIVAFEGSYHGLSLGALDATWRSDFRDPFAARLPGATVFARYGDIADVERVTQGATPQIGAVLVEPLQGRGGERVPPHGFLSELRALCNREGWLLIADEIYTGFGRTGKMWGCDHEGVVPDLLCIGKGLASGMPLSACMGPRPIMDAWPESRGEALHTQTFLGHPLSCAAAIASMRVLDEQGLVHRAAETGAMALERLATSLAGTKAVTDVRGRGLMLGIELRDSESALDVVAEALRRGVILLPAGDDGRVLSITPPLGIEQFALVDALDTIIELIMGLDEPRE